jgi:RNA-directed DNA polymerase
VSISMQMEFKFESVSSVPIVAKQETEARDFSEWGWVEASVWTERMLAALGNGVKGDKWYSLIDKIYDRRTLKAAWKRVASNKGAAGVDKISIKRFRSKEQFYLEELERDLRDGTYCPAPVKRVHIPKDGKKTRPLGIPTVSSYCTSCSLD